MDPESLQELAELAKLRLEPDQVARHQEQVARLLAWFDMLQGVSTEDVEPSPYPLPVPHRLRSDEAGAILPQEEVLANAPRTRAGSFLVPRVVES